VYTDSHKTDASLSHKRDRTKYGRLKPHIIGLFVQVTTIFICWRLENVNDCVLTWLTLKETVATPSTTTSKWTQLLTSTTWVLLEHTVEQQVCQTVVVLLLCIVIGRDTWMLNCWCYQSATYICNFLYAYTVWVKKSPLWFTDIFSQTVRNF